MSIERAYFLPLEPSGGAKTMQATIPTLITAATVALLCGGCADRSSPAGTTTTTSADVRSRDALSTARAERDRAIAQLSAERRARVADHQLYLLEQAARHDRDDLELRILDAYERSGPILQQLRDRVGKLGGKQQQDMTRALEAAKLHRDKLYTHLKRLHGTTEATAWEEFRTEVNATIAELDRLLSGVNTVK